MFSKCISETPLTTRAAESCFSKIMGESFDGDVSFLATLRALLHERISDDDPTVSLDFVGSSYTAEQIENHGGEAVMDAIEVTMLKGGFYVYNFHNRDSENNEACMELVNSCFTKRHPQFTRVQKVTDFFRKSFGVSCFIDSKDKCVALFCESLNIRKMHYLQCGIFAFLPWYFDPKEGVSELEMRLINSLRSKDPTEYEDCMIEFAEKFDFREMYIRDELQGFETRFIEHEIRNTEAYIDSCRERINSLNKEISDVIEEKSQKEIWMLGLQAKAREESEESEIMEYFIHNKDLFLDSVEGTRIVFSCRGYLEIFDEDMAEANINNPNSCVYMPFGRSCEEYIPASDMKKLMTAIFIEQTLKIRVCATYELILGARSDGVAGYRYGREFATYMPNTHIDKFRCTGNYRVEINKFMEHHDYIGAITQCIMSSRNLNFGDTTVMKYFMGALYEIGDYLPNNRCIELPDGSVVKPKEAINYLKKNEKGEDDE